MMGVPLILLMEWAVSHSIAVVIPIVIVPNWEMVLNLEIAYKHIRHRRLRNNIRINSPYRYTTVHINRESTNPNYGIHNDSSIGSNAVLVCTLVHAFDVDTMYDIVLLVSIVISFRNKNHGTTDSYWSDVVDERHDCQMAPLVSPQSEVFRTMHRWRVRHIPVWGNQCERCHKSLRVLVHLHYLISIPAHSLQIHDGGNVPLRRLIMYTKTVPIAVDGSSPCW